MKILAPLLLLAVIAAIGAWESLWRFDHRMPEGATATANYVAQIRTLPEGSVRPYGHGVFIRHRHIPLWATSTLVFAGYCNHEHVAIAWTTAQELTVRCVPSEGTVVELPPPTGITVIHDGEA